MITFLLVFYMVGGWTWLVWSLCMYAMPFKDWHEKEGARRLLCTPIWPILWIPVAIKQIRILIKVSKSEV